MKIGIILLVALVLTAASLHVYFIRDGIDGEVLWNTSEAYFFTGINTHGLHISLLGYPRLFATQLLRGVELADDDRRSWAIIRVTSSGSEPHVVAQANPDPASGPTMYTPRGGHIYANYPALGGLCVWVGDHFEPATLDGRRGFDGISALTMNDFENENGWSKRGFGVDASFTIAVGDKFTISVKTVPVTRIARGAISIDVLHPGRAPTRILTSKSAMKELVGVNTSTPSVAVS